MTRDERQTLCLQNWLKSKGKGTIVAATGFGKTKVGLMAIKALQSQKPDIKILVIVPTTVLKEQWDNQLLFCNSEVVVVNTVIKNQYQCDLLIIDEIHRVNAITYQKVFDVVKYKYILGLTATFERLDGRHVITQKYCPVCDSISMEECQENGWVSDYNEYLVLVDVDDISTYKEMNKTFITHFEFFDFQFDSVYMCLGQDGFKNRWKLANKMCPNGNDEQKRNILAQITYHATAFNRILQQRKAFINNHNKKIELSRLIIDNYPDKKILLFANSIKMAEAVQRGKVYSGRDTKRQGRITINEFNNQEAGCLCTIRKADEGLDVRGLSIGIVIGLDSSSIRSTQRLGRICRFEDGKSAAMFNIVIKDTVEESWYDKSHKPGTYKIIDEKGLQDVLCGISPKPYTKKIGKFQFRY